MSPNRIKLAMVLILLGLASCSTVQQQPRQESAWQELMDGPNAVAPVPPANPGYYLWCKERGNDTIECGPRESVR